MTIRRNYLHWLWRWPCFVLWLLVAPLLFFVLKGLGFASYQKVPHLFHRGVCFVLGIQAEYSGHQTDIRPCLFVSNHISYLDVFVLGQIPAWFIAKSEVADWPVLGYMAKFQNTLFIKRQVGKAKQQIEILRNHLQERQNLILFPEGTSTDGVHVKPFKSSLFAAASIPQATEPVAIQPITIAYTHQAGQKMNQVLRDYYAWYDTMPFAPHFFALFSLKSVSVKVYFHPVCYFDKFASRKECADYCQRLVENKLNEFIEES